MSGLWSGGSIPDRVSKHLLMAPNLGGKVRDRAGEAGPI